MPSRLAAVPQLLRAYISSASARACATCAGVMLPGDTICQAISRSSRLNVTRLSDRSSGSHRHALSVRRRWYHCGLPASSGDITALVPVRPRAARSPIGPGLRRVGRSPAWLRLLASSRRPLLDVSPLHGEAPLERVDYLHARDLHAALVKLPDRRPVADRRSIPGRANTKASARLLNSAEGSASAAAAMCEAHLLDASLRCNAQRLRARPAAAAADAGAGRRARPVVMEEEAQRPPYRSNAAPPVRAAVEAAADPSPIGGAAGFLVVDVASRMATMSLLPESPAAIAFALAGAAGTSIRSSDRLWKFRPAASRLPDTPGRPSPCFCCKLVIWASALRFLLRQCALVIANASRHQDHAVDFGIPIPGMPPGSTFCQPSFQRSRCCRARASPITKASEPLQRNVFPLQVED